VGAFALILGGSVLATRGGRRPAEAGDEPPADQADARQHPVRAQAVAPASSDGITATAAGVTAPGDAQASQQVPSGCN
jgi:hypothetical protein